MRIKRTAIEQVPGVEGGILRRIRGFSLALIFPEYKSVGKTGKIDAVVRRLDIA
jgi:hypothetical protein